MIGWLETSLFLSMLGISLVVLIVVPTAIGYWVVSPINRLVRRVKAPLQFQLSDFFWLLVQLQIALAFVVSYVPRQEHGLFAGLLSYLFFAAVGLWIGAVLILSRASIRRPLRRGAVIVVLLPVTLLLMIGSTISVIAIVAFLHQAVIGLFDGPLNEGLRPANMPILALVTLGVAVVTPASCWLLRRLTNWIVAEPSASEDAAAEDAVPQDATAD